MKEMLTAEVRVQKGDESGVSDTLRAQRNDVGEGVLDDSSVDVLLSCVHYALSNVREGRRNMIANADKMQTRRVVAAVADDERLVVDVAEGGEARIVERRHGDVLLVAQIAVGGGDDGVRSRRKNEEAAADDDGGHQNVVAARSAGERIEKGKVQILGIQVDGLHLRRSRVSGNHRSIRGENSERGDGLVRNSSCGMMDSESSRLIQ